MRIGFEAKRIFHNRTGLGNYSRDLVRILSRFYPGNTYFLYNPKPGRAQLFETDGTLTVEKLPSGFFFRRFYNLWRQRGIISDLKKNEIDLFHGLSGELPSGLNRNGIKSIVTIHDLIFLKFPQFYSFFDRKIHYWKFRNAARNADRIIAISRQTKADIVRYLGIPETRISVVYQGCQDVFRNHYSTEEKELVRSKYSLPERFLLNVGTIEIRKNVLSAIKAIRSLDTHLVIVGAETDYIRDIRRYLDAEDIHHKVSFLKGISNRELAMLYQMADIFVYPSLYEGFGIPIIEALFSGTPVITSAGSCFPEAGGPGSIYIDPNNTDALSAAISDLLQHKSKRDQMKTAGLTYARHFEDENISQKIMQVYRDVLNTEPAS